MTNTPNDTLKITVGSKEQELFMPYALLSDLSSIVEADEEAMEGSPSKEKRDEIITKCLTKRGRAGFIEGEFDLYELDISGEDFERVIDWAMEHILSFFIRRMRSGNKMMDRLAKDLETDQVSSETSSETSTS